MTKTTAVFGFCAACVAGVLKALTFFRFIFHVCMLAFMLVCEFLYILITDPIFIFIFIFNFFSGFEIRTMTVSCPKELSVGHLNIYHLANKLTDVNVFVHQSDI